MSRKRKPFLIAAFIGVLGLSAAQANVTFAPNWKSLQQYKCPEWFRDAKLGIFMHWGVNTVPAYDGHYGRYMYIQDPNGVKATHQSVYEHHVKTYGHPSKFGYKDFIPMWKAEKWDPDALVRFYKQIGVRYIVPVAVHCDNFDNYDSTHQSWNSVNMGPKRDIIGQWKQAAERHGLRFGVSSHLGEWAHVWYARASDTSGPLKGVPYDVTDPNYAGLYGDRGDDRTKLQAGFKENWFLRTKELVDKYQPDLLYFDSGLPYENPYGLRIAAHFYNANSAWHNGRLEAVLNVKRKFTEGAVVHDIEKGQAKELRALPWQTDTTINSGWFYQTRKYGHGHEMPSGFYLDETVLIDKLVDIVSKNGNLLLNVGLRADGTLPDDQRYILQEMGDWLVLNGEAIFDTRPWIKYGEGPTQNETGYNTEPRTPWDKRDIRFTTKGKTLYTIALDWPGEKAFTVTSLSDRQPALGPIQSVQLLGHEGTLKWRRNAEGLTIQLPKRRPCKYAYVFKIVPTQQ